MKCHYEILQVSKNASSDDIKKAYRKLAIKWHPDKNLDNIEEATEQFQLIQQAFEVLSDPHERAWYDDHRDAILKGKVGDHYDDDSLDLYQYFTASCYKGFGDDKNGFYAVYEEVFNKIAAEDSEYQTEGDSDFEIPTFGNSKSTHEEVKSFYDYWQSYCTKKTYSWLDPYDVRTAPNRKVSRLIDKENKKIRDKARKARNEEIRELVSFVRKRDKRVQAYAQYLSELSAEKAKKSEEIRIKNIKKRKSELASHKESEWSKFSNLENELKNIEASVASEFGDSVSPDETDEEEILDHNLYCVACNKLFKTSKSFQNHETSKKHKENVLILKTEMVDDELEINIDLDDTVSGDSDTTGVEADNDYENDSDSVVIGISHGEKNGLHKTEVNNCDTDINSIKAEDDDDEEEGPLYCKACEKWFNTAKAVENHKLSKKHLEKYKTYKELLKNSGNYSDCTDIDDFSISDQSEKYEFSDDGSDKSESFNRDLEKVIAQFDLLEQSESYSLKEDIEKLFAEIDGNQTDDDFSMKKSKKKNRTKHGLKYEENSDDNSDFSFKQNKKSKRKQKNKQKNTTKPDDKLSDVNSEKAGNISANETPESLIGSSETSAFSISEGNDGMVLKEKAELPEMKSSECNVNETNYAASKKNLKSKKSKQDEEDCSNFNLLCAVCEAKFPSKNKLFQHLAATGHSVHPEKLNKMQVGKDVGKKGKSKRNKK